MMTKLEIYGRIRVNLIDVREFLDFLRRNGVFARTIAKEGYNEVILMSL